jgi:sensor histidine kinase YesM
MFQPYSRLIVIAMIWTAVLVVHTLFIHLNFDFGIGISLADAFVYNFFFLLISIGLWHLTSYMSIGSRKTSDLIINHLSLALVTIAIWVSLSGYILKLTFGSETSYVAFIENSVSFRVVTGFMYYMVTVWVFYLIRALEKAKWQLEREEKISGMLHEAELKALRTQMNPHFLFNSLNSIHSLTMTDPEKAGQMIIHLSDLMRYSLTRQEQMVSFSEEVNQIRRYLDIERIRFSERLSVEIKVTEDCEKVPVPSMLFQPLIENAVKYGIYGIEKNVTIRLEAIISDNILVTRISNNYDPTMTVKKGTGLGLKNVSERLAVVYHRSDLLMIDKKEEEFTVHLKIPV